MVVIDRQPVRLSEAHPGCQPVHNRTGQKPREKNLKNSQSLIKMTPLVNPMRLCVCFLYAISQPIQTFDTRLAQCARNDWEHNLQCSRLAMAMMQEGQYTKTIYTLIRNQQYTDAIGFLEPILQVRVAFNYCSLNISLYFDRQIGASLPDVSARNHLVDTAKAAPAVRQPRSCVRARTATGTLYL